MASIITGLTGSVTLPNSGSQALASVSLSIGKDLADVSHFGGNGWRERIALLKDLAGTAAGFLTYNAAGTNPYDLIDGAEASMVITFATGCSITFVAVIGNFSIQNSYDGVAIISFSFSKGSGVPVVAWDELS
jgi:hypothetical protein